jgi:hypothetical protein
MPRWRLHKSCISWWKRYTGRINVFLKFEE